MSDRIVTRHISPYVAIQGTDDRDLAPVPNPMASFEDTTHAYECGYRDGIRAAQPAAPTPAAPATSLRYGRRKLCSMLANWSALRDAVRCGDVVAVQTAFDACEEWVDFAFQPAAPAVKVKPLVWRERDEDTFWAAEGCGEMYYIRHYAGMKLPYRVEPSRLRGIGHPDLEAAKAAAQADYNARILAALEGR